MNKPKELYGKAWSEREYIIVLYYYFKNRGEIKDIKHPVVHELSELLGRTPGSILMRLGNYINIDPENIYKTKGLSHWNEFCKNIFDEWKEKKTSLEDVVSVLIRETNQQNKPDLFEPFPVKIPRAFDRYELLDQIGQGSFGTVFSCIEIQSQKPFAIKIINVDKIYDNECIHRFGREVHALKLIKHPSIISIYEDNLESEASFPAFIMDLCFYNLTDHLKNNDKGIRPVLSREESMKIIFSIINAIKALHNNSNPVIHRDINPGNILLLEENRWVLSDFSLAKFLPPAPVSTAFESHSKLGWGTGFYTAPEQYRSFKYADQRADIYSLGILLWDLLSTEYGPPDLHENFTGLQPQFENIVLKATQRKPDNRYSCIEDFEKALMDISD